MSRMGCIAVASIVLLSTVAFAQETTKSLKQEREEKLSEIGISKIPNPDEIRQAARSLFSQPIDKQSEQELERLAEIANVLANLIGYIREEYDDYHRDNYRYDFVQKKVAPPLKAYTKRNNEFIRIRNKAYFNLGLKSKTSGQVLRAFFYFRDAFRLSGFDCGETPAKNCIRWKAEQEMQKLLGMSDIKAFVTWK